MAFEKDVVAKIERANALIPEMHNGLPMNVVRRNDDAVKTQLPVN